ncbi:SdiA-regulated domain-containing protein [Pseudomonas sp. RL_15y_Pfl2_60]|uniref:SdiA-regulated domain-containing protein n=1 Tax=Pseudomonas sp. RL_15y_Pfl2_60 TaxID=3088709 RepID=UPI0030D7AE68
MPQSSKVFSTVFRSLLVLMLVVFVSVGLYQRWDERALFLIKELQTSAEVQAASIWLPSYRVTLAGKPIAGLEEGEVSGLTYRASSNTLFTILGKHTELVELSLTGDVLRRIPVTGLENPEGVEVLSGDLMAIVDERQRTLTVFPLTAATTQINARQQIQVDLGFAKAGNKGFEGLGWDSRRKLILLAKERDPRGFYSLPLPSKSGPAQGMLELNIDDVFVRDISSVSFDPRTGHSLMLSDESRVLVELDANAKPRSFISFASGRNGLGWGIKQPEGVTIGADGSIYVISEPNLFYVLSK